ncbi:hypothetical protein SISSUDRAFT_623133 [Sistotremastrum suecicum HHB10207 ss-3]|uniref:DNA replication checkpoint mediator MRC1 domain-containing protein n=1 Tax=Sistotremastrum suecicum HHB10207 ss-3 TaxID=1314776 RepID=A0A166EIF6_9AGAM|nr:hypothetical protein SISSUDRAFT_623133 [Sistotremastrum suecicum HHB10207 ss-3]
MRAAAEPLFQHKSSRGPSGKPSQIRQHDMERFTLERAKEQANALTGKKEKEFVDRGGRLKKASETPLALEDVSTKVQGLLEAENVEADDEDDAMEDADWTPEKEDEDVSAMQDTEDGASRPSPPIVDESDDEDKENQPVPPTGLIDDEERHGHELPVRRSHAIPQVVDSDDEDQESLMPSSNILVPDTSMIDDTDIEDESLEPRSLFPELEETSNRASLFPLNAESSQYSTQGTKVDFEPIPLKATGLSQFFGTQQFKSGFLDRLEKIDDPMSPAPISQLLPAIEMSTQERAEEAEIFQEDQDERRRDVEFSQPPATKPPMYMTEGGFFTQTKPASQAMVPLMSNSGIQSQLSQQTPSIRPPLATLSWTENSPPSDAPLRRLRKGIRSPGNDDNDSVGPSPRRHSRPQSAEKKKQQKPKKPLGKSEYVMGEAEESDEEAEFGFGGHRKKDDEESGDEDANIVLADLVNDDAVNENIDLVRAKAKEHELADDERVQEKVQEVVDGKYRAKRRNRGVDLGSDEESDDDDEDDRRIRNKMRSKKRKIEGDELDIIGKNPYPILNLGLIAYSSCKSRDCSVRSSIPKQSRA